MSDRIIDRLSAKADNDGTVNANRVPDPDVTAPAAPELRAVPVRLAPTMFSRRTVARWQAEYPGAEFLVVLPRQPQVGTPPAAQRDLPHAS